MGSISLQIPQSGQLNSTEDPKIASDFTTLQTWANGNVDHTNLSGSAGILTSQMAAGAVRFNSRVITSAATLADGDFATVNATAGSVTVTLPIAAAGAWCGVTSTGNGASGGSGPIVVQRQGSDQIYVTQFPPVLGLTSITHVATLAPLVFYAPAALQWQLVAGEFDTGWLALTLGANISSIAGAYVPAMRLKSDVVHLRGAMKATGSIAATSTVLTTPTPPSALSYGPSSSNVWLGAVSILAAANAAYPLEVLQGGSGSAATIEAGTAIPTNTELALDGLNYSVY